MPHEWYILSNYACIARAFSIRFTNRFLRKDHIETHMKVKALFG